MRLTLFLYEHPELAALAWLVLHSLDYGLTIAGAKVRQRRADQVVQVPGSYELNPIFQTAVDRGRWISKRFIFSLVGVAVLLYVVVVLDRQVGEIWGLGAVLGVLLFTRLAVIGRHLQNIWLFSRIANRPESVTGSIRYDRPTVYLISAFSSGQVAVLLAVAAAIAPDPLLVGGAFGNLVLAVLAAVLARRGRSRPDPAATTGQATA